MVGRVDVFEYNGNPAVTWTESRRHFLLFFIPVRLLTRSFIYVTGGSYTSVSQVPTLTIQNNNSRRRHVRNFLSFLFFFVISLYVFYFSSMAVSIPHELFFKRLEEVGFSLSLTPWGGIWNVFCLWIIYDFIYYIGLLCVFFWVEAVFEKNGSIEPDYYIKFWAYSPMFYHEDLVFFESFMISDVNEYKWSRISHDFTKENTVIVKSLFKTRVMLPITSTCYSQEWARLFHDKLDLTFSPAVRKNIIHNFEREERIKKSNNPSTYKSPIRVQYNKEEAYQDFVDSIEGLLSHMDKRQTSLSGMKFVLKVLKSPGFNNFFDAIVYVCIFYYVMYVMLEYINGLK